MRNHVFSVRPRWQAAILAGALGAGLACSVQAQMPMSSLRLVSETPTAAPAPVMTAEALRDAAVDAYVYAYPMVLMEVTRRAATGVQTAVAGRAPMNQWGHRTQFPDPQTTDVAWPGTEALYSSLWYDVTREPLIIDVPDAGQRHVLLTLHDMWSDMYAARGTRTTGNGAQRFAIVGPSWQGTLPAGVEMVRSPTGMGWAIARMQTASPAEFGIVNQFQGSLAATPLRVAQPFGTAAPGRAEPAWSASQQATPAEQVAAMDAASYFTLFAQLLRDNPPHANDHPMLDRLRRLGFDGMRPFSFGTLNPSVQQALAEAAPIAGRRIADAVQNLGTEANGWSVVRHGIGTYGTDYLRRAAVAYAGLGASTAEEVLYPVTTRDDEGEPLNSDEDYVLHFEPGQLPPVDGYWSLILYDSRLGLARNPANRYAIHSTDALAYNPDGSLDLYIRRDPPRSGKEANWLPAPQEGPFMLNLRLYAPRDTALDGQWAPPPVRED
ncbi:DUF1254 domain-containing protein [Bordetella sp. 2513F-2]